MGRIVLVTGGCRSGKSAHAQQMAESLPPDPVPPTPEAAGGSEVAAVAEPPPATPPPPATGPAKREALRLLLLTESSRTLPEGLLALVGAPDSPDAIMVGG